MVALCPSKEDRPRTVVAKWAYISRMELRREVADILKKKVNRLRSKGDWMIDYCEYLRACWVSMWYRWDVHGS